MEIIFLKANRANFDKDTKRFSMNRAFNSMYKYLDVPKTLAGMLFHREEVYPKTLADNSSR